MFSLFCLSPDWSPLHCPRRTSILCWTVHSINDSSAGLILTPPLLSFTWFLILSCGGRNPSHRFCLEGLFHCKFDTGHPPFSCSPVQEKEIVTSITDVFPSYLLNDEETDSVEGWMKSHGPLIVNSQNTSSKELDVTTLYPTRSLILPSSPPIS